jgi:hypothetical protein
VIFLNIFTEENLLMFFSFDVTFVPLDSNECMFSEVSSEPEKATSDI